ncbi:Potassium-transporting ATPase KdpC subunit [Bienertia sinuspersici]
MESITLKYFHGGVFKKSDRGLVYWGGHIKTFEVDPDELCGFWLKDLVRKCGVYENVECKYYLLPNMTLERGLRKVFTDDEVREMAEIASKDRCMDLYVYHGGQSPESLISPTQSSRPPKLTPKKAPSVKAVGPPRRSPRNKDSIKESVPTLVSVEQPQVNAFVGPTPHSIQNPSEIVETNNHNYSIPNNPPQINSNECEPHSPQPQPLEIILGPSQPEPSQPEPSQPEPSQPELFHTDLNQSEPFEYDWIDPRPDVPLTLEQLLKGYYESEDESASDPEYEPVEELSDVDEEEFDDFDDGNGTDEEEFVDPDLLQIEAADVDTSDDECRLARERVRGCKQHLNDIAERVEREVAEGRFGDLKSAARQPREEEQRDDEIVGDVDESDEEIQTPPESGDEDSIEERKRKRSLLVGVNTDFETFKWKVGQRFARKEDVKNAVAKYGVLQGRNVSFTISNKKRQQRLGVQCADGCPFRLYLSWDTRRAAFVVKTVGEEHTCVRTMTKNKQLKANWVADQMLEVFKNRPHWPAKEICTAIRLAYKVLVKRDFAYKVKYFAHKKLHGSMKAHYAKSILTCVAEVLPNCEHRHCARHIFCNWHKSFRGDDMKLRFWCIAKAYNAADYTEAFEELEKEFPAAANAFNSYNPKVFCRQYMKTTTKADVITSNMVETFNNYIINARTKHLTTMLEEIRALLMQRVVMKKKEVEKWKTDICPRVQVKLDKEKNEASKWRPRKNRIKDPYENPKKPGSLTRHGIEMTCSICQTKGHNKRRCPNRDNATEQPKQKRARGRPRSITQQTSQQMGNEPSTSHHDSTAEPSRIGRGGRMVLPRGRGRTSQGRGRGSTASNSQGRGRGAAQSASNSQTRGRGRARGRGISRGT